MNTILLDLDTTLLSVAEPCHSIHWQTACLAWSCLGACVPEAAVLKPNHPSICTYWTLAAGTSRTALLLWQTILLPEGCYVQVNRILLPVGIKLMEALETWQQPPKGFCQQLSHAGAPEPAQAALRQLPAR